MKTLITAICAVVLVECSCAQISTNQWSMNLKVVDDAGQSVASAKVGIAYSVFDKLHWTNVVGRIEGLTDTNGIFAASHEGAYSLGLQVEKEGYYPVNVV